MKEYTAKQIAEMVAHTHGPGVGTYFVMSNADVNNGGGGGIGQLGFAGSAPTVTGSRGSTTPFNLISPTAVANYIIKT